MGGRILKNYTTLIGTPITLQSELSGTDIHCRMDGGEKLGRSLLDPKPDEPEPKRATPPLGCAGNFG